MSRTIREVLFSAIVNAKQDRQSLIEAYGHELSSHPAVKTALRDIRNYEWLQVKLFGTTETALDVKISEMTGSVDMFNTWALKKLMLELIPDEEE